MAKKDTNKTSTVAHKTSIKASDVGTVEQVLNDNKTVVTTPAVASKASVANPILAEMFGREVVPARKDMINRLCEADVGLTPKGAATYLQNFKKKNGLVKTAPQAAAATA